MKIRKGFTLVELLAVIVILGIIIGLTIVLYTGHMNKVKEDITKIEEKNILNSAEAYYEEFKDSGEYIKEDVYDGLMNSAKTTYSCVTLKSLIEKGYFKPDVKFSDSEIDVNKAIIKISTFNGVSNYEMITNPSSDDCSFYRLEKNFENIGVPTETELDNQSVKFDTNISNVNKIRYIYNLDLDLSLETKNIIDNYPVYVLLVLDKSGSMAGTKFNNSKSAAIKLSKTVVGINNSSYIGMIQFDNEVSNEIDFRRTPLESKDFANAGGNTNIIAAFDNALEKMSALPTQSLKYVIFLSDGQPYITTTSSIYGRGRLPQKKAHYATCTDSKVTDKCREALVGYRDKLNAINTTLVIVSYGIKIDSYKQVAALDNSGYYCPNSIKYDGNSRCYYESNSDQITTLFDSLSNAVSNLASIKSAQLTGKFNDIITVYDSLTDEVVKELNVNILFDDEIELNENNYRYLFKINNGGVSNCGETSCTFDILNDFELKLFNKDGVQLPSPDVSSPQLKVDITPDSYLN